MCADTRTEKKTDHQIRHKKKTRTAPNESAQVKHKKKKKQINAV